MTQNQVILTETQKTLLGQALAGDGGDVLIDVVTDQIVLSATLTAEQKEGAGVVLRLLRDAKEETFHQVKPTK